MIDKDEISDWRQRIDAIDSEILKLLEERFEACRKIGKFKKENGLPIEDVDREKQIIENKKKLSDLDDGFVDRLFREIMEESKRLQRE